MKLDGSARSCVAVAIGCSVTKGDAAALGADAASSCFKKLHDAETHPAAADAFLAIEYALGEVRDGCLERL